jgi:hypothetical protein
MRDNRERQNPRKERICPMTVSDLSEAMKTLLKESAHRQGAESGWKQRTSPLSSEIFVQTLVFGFLENPEATYPELARVAGRMGAEVTKQAICERITAQSVTLFKKVLEDAFGQMVQGDPVEQTWLQTFSGIYLNDSTQISWPDEWADQWDGGGIAAAMKLPVCLDMLRGRIQVDLIAARTHDSVTCWPNQEYPPNSVVIEDMGYLDQDRMNERAQKHVYTVIPCRSTMVFHEESGQVLDVGAWVRSRKKEVKERLVSWNGASYRLVAVPLSKTSTKRRRAHIRESARKHGREPNATSLALAPWYLVLTTLPPERATTAQVAILMRMRWQIELLFKVWKDQGKLDESRGFKPERLETEFYAKLLGLLLQHWIILSTGWAWVDRSLVQMGQTIREEIRTLCACWSDLAGLTQWCQILTRLMRKTARISSHINQPSTSSLLLLASEQVGPAIL